MTRRRFVGHVLAVACLTRSGTWPDHHQAGVASLNGKLVMAYPSHAFTVLARDPAICRLAELERLMYHWRFLCG